MIEDVRQFPQDGGRRRALYDNRDVDVTAAVPVVAEHEGIDRDHSGQPVAAHRACAAYELRQIGPHLGRDGTKQLGLGPIRPVWSMTEMACGAAHHRLTALATGLPILPEACSRPCPHGSHCSPRCAGLANAMGKPQPAGLVAAPPRSHGPTGPVEVTAADGFNGPEQYRAITPADSVQPPR